MDLTITKEQYNAIGGALVAAIGKLNARLDELPATSLAVPNVKAQRASLTECLTILNHAYSTRN